MLMGNPVVLWLGLAACAALAVFRKSPRYLIMFALALLPWMIPSRSNTFYYYYFPAACIVTLALAAWARDHWTKSWFRGIGYAAFILAAAFFVYNLPLVTGQIMSLSEVLERYPYDLTPPSSR
jgi:dolichyl-phosphate-mannose--protein O-mannosyl transferase